MNYTPQEMATRAMHLTHPDEFLLWYFRRFASYRHIQPNIVHDWLADKKLITQNIDGLDGKAGNADYIPIHGRLDKVTVLHAQGDEVDLIDAPWEKVVATCSNLEKRRQGIFFLCCASQNGSVPARWWRLCDTVAQLVCDDGCAHSPC